MSVTMFSGIFTLPSSIDKRLYVPSTDHVCLLCEIKDESSLKDMDRLPSHFLHTQHVSHEIAGNYTYVARTLCMLERLKWLLGVWRGDFWLFHRGLLSKRYKCQILSRPYLKLCNDEKIATWCWCKIKTCKEFIQCIQYGNIPDDSVKTIGHVRKEGC